MGRYDFDTVQDRKNTSCIKWDFGMQRKGRDDLLPLWVADMDFRLPDEVIEDIVKRAEHGIFGYTDPEESYFFSVREWYRKRHGIEFESKEITVVPGVVYAIGQAVRALTREGEAVLLQQPVYYPFSEMIRVNKRKLINSPLVYREGRYEIDFEDFEKKIIENNVRMYLLCSPHNPVGRVWTRSELERIADICYRHDVYVFADEIHSDFVYDGYEHVSFYALDDKYKEKLVLGTSASKTFNIAGLQVANIIIPNDDVRAAFRAEVEGSGYSQPNVFGLVATKSVYDKGGQWLDELREYLQGNLDHVRSFIKENLPGVKLIEPEGTYLIWLDFSKVVKDRKKLRELIEDKAKLWLDPGAIFGEESALFERINIACPRQILDQALEQLKEAGN